MTDIRIARSGDVDVAYRVVGDGPIDLVYAQGQLTHLEICWELPQFRRYCERLAEFTRLILFDKRGMGMSDRVPGATTLDERMDDIRAILDAVGSERAAVMGESEGGPLALLFAAAHPERTRRADHCRRLADRTSAVMGPEIAVRATGVRGGCALASSGRWQIRRRRGRAVARRRGPAPRA